MNARTLTTNVLVVWRNTGSVVYRTHPNRGVCRSQRISLIDARRRAVHGCGEEEREGENPASPRDKSLVTSHLASNETN